VTPQIDHVVVLALENRSFDHLLGYLDHPNPSFDGVAKGGPYTNGGWNGAAGVAVNMGAKTVMPVCPDHSHDAAMEQLGLTGRPPWSPTNSGFVTSYERICRGLAPPAFGGIVGPLIEWWRSRSAPPPPITGRGPLIMECQDPAHLPALATLARSFATYTRWFCSVPGETWPNRNFMHSATSDGETDIDPRLYTNKTIFEVLEQFGRDWHIYYDDTPQVWAFVNLWDTPSRHANWYQFAVFDQHCRAGTLPAYSFIEPNHRPSVHVMDSTADPKMSNNQHPGNNLIGNSDYDAAPPYRPGDFANADALVASVYESLRANPDLFDRTVLVITYDEHGGLYDHVPPPTGVPNPGSDPTLLRRILRAIYHRKAAAFDFSVLGPRVPTVIVSPHVEAGYISTETCDHASICSTLRTLFAPGAPPLTSRDAWAPTFLDSVGLDQARTNLPDLSVHKLPASPTAAAPTSGAPSPPVGPDAATPEHYQPYVDLAAEVRHTLAARGVPEAVATPGAPAMEKAAQTVVAFTNEAVRTRRST
jgi:phospholipase C